MGILPTESHDSHTRYRQGEFTGYVNVLSYDGEMPETIATFEAEEGLFRVVEIDNDFMFGSLELSALGVTRGDFMPADLTLMIDFGAWWDLPNVPYTH